MRVTYVPQRTDRNVAYIFDGERIIAYCDGEAEEYDFSAMPEGVLEDLPDTVLPTHVLLGAERKDGELHVMLLRPIPARPQPRDFDSPEEYEAELSAWQAMWNDLEEVR